MQYVSRCGVWANGWKLESDDYPSLSHSLNAAGYESWLGGKMHFGPDRLRLRVKALSYIPMERHR